jgi:RND superfamily putative drug exporter
VGAWTRLIVAHRRSVIASWLVLIVLGGYATSNLGKLLTNRFSVPGSDAEKGLNILRSRFAERGDGAFTLVVQSTGSALNPAVAEAAAQRAARQIKQGKAGLPRSAGPDVLYVQIQTPLQAADAKNHTEEMRRAIGAIPGAKTYLTGFPALAHDEQPIYSHDLSRGEAIAVPIALAVLVFMFGTLGAVVVPIAFVVATLPTTLGPGVGDRAPRQHGPVRHQHHHADRAGDRDRLLDACRVPLP